MIAQIRGIITGVKVGEKRWNNEVQKDRHGNPVMDRKLIIIDTDDENMVEPIKVNFDADQEDIVRSLVKQEVVANLSVGRMNKYTFFRLLEFKA